MYSLAFLTAKLLDIGLVTVYYFLSAFTLSWLVDRWMGPFDEEKAGKRPLVYIILEVIFQFFLLGVLAYIVRNIVERISGHADEEKEKKSEHPGLGKFM